MHVSCRLSLQYHPDKNKNKGAQEKFAEINNGKTHISFHVRLPCVREREREREIYGVHKNSSVG